MHETTIEAKVKGIMMMYEYVEIEKEEQKVTTAKTNTCARKTTAVPSTWRARSTRAPTLYYRTDSVAAFSLF